MGEYNMSFSFPKIPSRKKGQGAFEYILLLAGILLIVVLVIVILKSGLTQQASAGITGTSNKIQANINTKCLDFCGDGAWDTIAIQNSTLQIIADTTTCTYAAGMAGTEDCFYKYDGSTITDECNVSLHLHPKSDDTVNITTYDGAAPNNVKFCQLVQTT